VREQRRFDDATRDATHDDDDCWHDRNDDEQRGDGGVGGVNGWELCSWERREQRRRDGDLRVDGLYGADDVVRGYAGGMLRECGEPSVWVHGEGDLHAARAGRAEVSDDGVFDCAAVLCDGKECLWDRRDGLRNGLRGFRAGSEDFVRRDAGWQWCSWWRRDCRVERCGWFWCCGVERW
jgi:hypothetical protein